MRFRNYILPLALLAAGTVGAQEAPKEEDNIKPQDTYELRNGNEKPKFETVMDFWIDEHTYRNLRPDRFGFGHVFMDVTRSQNGIVEHIIPVEEHERVARNLFGDISGDVFMDMNPWIRDKVNKYEKKTEKGSKRLSFNTDWLEFRTVFSFSDGVGVRAVFPNIGTHLHLSYDKSSVAFQRYFYNGAYFRLAGSYKYDKGYEMRFFTSIPLESLVDWMEKKSH